MRKSQSRIERKDAKSSNDPLKLEYEDYLRNQRGLSERTIYHCWRFADRFLHFRFGGKTRDLHKIAPTDIVRFTQHLVARGKPFRDKTPSTHLRNFFRFLFKSAKTNVNLTPTVPRVAQKYASSLLRHLTPEQVETLIAAVRTDTAIGRRNFAMVLLLDWIARSGSHCNPDRRYRLARGRAPRSWQGTIA